MTAPRRLWQALRAGRLGVYLIALWKLFQHPQTPRAVRWVALAVLAYALSPIDLIPDFIPVLGMLDDLVLIPLGIALVVRLTPREQWQARLREAETEGGKLPRLLWGAAIIVLLWLAAAAFFGWWVFTVMRGAL
jgi:uncharacterized membrane protein YkvA (DUF1232 family)